MTIKYNHFLTLDNAILKSKDLIAKSLLEYKGQYSKFTENWQGDLCKYEIIAKGQKIYGQIKVDRNLVLLDISLPWIFLLFESKIKKEIESKLFQHFKS
ncbi:MAG: putative polyhydroxyalkanoic acid system protein gran rgn [Ferruginibacter sp.]|uniref:polyhydroxyalkanoic acid system family protein n=1 Tax=Ferruginibacter sp. TaxID=1940288 RepID=UPI002659129A|nr:polyhydroxyalkanoic acid system family protein [Ferruginibacter sp.]MDB5280249.1 putative polyhydroxyalkanoic acid system protein gran rgn [Ferruginibacter sp.]